MHKVHQTDSGVVCLVVWTANCHVKQVPSEASSQGASNYSVWHNFNCTPTDCGIRVSTLGLFRTQEMNESKEIFI